MLASIRWSAAVLVLAATAAGPAPGLQAAAEKEGSVVWYATMNTKDLNDTVRAFNRRYPKVQVQTLRMGSAQLPARVITEQRGGKFNADVLSGDEFQLSQLVSAGALDRYRVADAGRFLPFTTDANGYWTSLYMNTTVIAWNPQRLKADNLTSPRTLTDLLKPAWSGKVGIDTGALNWYLGVLRAYRDGPDLVRRLAANHPAFVAGHTEAVTQLETGEFDATPTAYGYLAEAEKAAGKPVDFIDTKPVLVTLNPAGLAKSAPHPNAARLLLGWLLSRDGQQFLAAEGGGEISSRTDVKNDSKIWNPKASYLLVPAPDATTYNASVRSFREVFGIAI